MIYTVIIDQTESFFVEVEASSKEDALKKAESVNPADGNVPHYSETKVIGIDPQQSVVSSLNQHS
jgi:NADPH-dependent 2,4-dienoyl-CoA reductase/sulfur reductase-like enzyme